MAGIAGLSAALLAIRDHELGNPWVLLALALAAVLADRASVRLTDTTELTISPVLTLFAAVLLGPLQEGWLAPHLSLETQSCSESRTADALRTSSG